MNTQSNKEMEVLIAAKLFESGTLTMSQAARSAGYTMSEFMDLLKNYNVSVINHPASDLESDVSNARESIKNLKK
jgi:predicted HTH domain antitoxin